MSLAFNVIIKIILGEKPNTKGLIANPSEQELEELEDENYYTEKELSQSIKQMLAALNS